MQLPRRGVPPPRYSPDEDFGYDPHHEAIQASRRPLSESTGNAQAHDSLGALALCHGSHHLSLSPPLHSIPTPPILPTQSITSTYGTSFRNQRSLHRNVSLQESPMPHMRADRNPIYAWKKFGDYRAKVRQKEAEKEEPKWPLYLEDAFLDALLLIPFMGRKKFSSKDERYGRNMLVSEYLWICYWLLFPPSQDQTLPVGKAREDPLLMPDGKEIDTPFRDRKKVSSHIQVLKGFFLEHPCFHFFFPRKNDDDKTKEKRHYKEEEGIVENFKHNPILIALANGRLPDERPNYEYFGRLLNAENEIFVKPKKCWVYVSSLDVTLSPDYKEAIAMDGTVLMADAFTPDGLRLEGHGDYPHLVLNNSKDIRKELRSGREDEPTKYILHEYTNKLTQKESSSIRDISAVWNHDFPELRDNLAAAMEETNSAHERTSRCVVGPCDILHFEVVLDLHATSRFPSGTHLEGSVHLEICRPELANHRWRSVTSVSKPEALEHDDSEEPFWNCANMCDLVGPQKNLIEVPFPAKSWASTFMALSKYVTAEKNKTTERRSKVKTEDGLVIGSEGLDDKPTKSSGKKPSSSSKLLTPTELLDQVAMYQEVWSAPNDGSEKPRWTRRVIVLWNFENARTKIVEKKKEKEVVITPGTHWRFLTKVDPMSHFHQQNATVRGSPRVSRGPGADDTFSADEYHHGHHSGYGGNHYASAAAALHDGFGMDGYDPATAHHNQHHNHHMPGLSGQSMHNSYHPSSLSLMDSVSSGCLATPPPTASLSSSYAHSFESATIASTDSLHHHVSFLSDGSGTDSQGTLVGSGNDHHHGGGGSSSTTDPFLAGLSVPVDGTSFDEDPSLQAWATASSTGGIGALDQWATTYVDSQNSLAWADNHGVAGLGVVDDLVGSSRDDAASWGDAKDSLWNTNTTNQTDSASASQKQQQQQNDVWATASSQAWLQSIAATADASSRYDHENTTTTTSSWDDHLHNAPHHHDILGSSTSSSTSLSSSLHPSAASQMQQHGNIPSSTDPEHDFDDRGSVTNNENDDHGVLALLQHATSVAPDGTDVYDNASIGHHYQQQQQQHPSRKRARTEEEERDEDGGEGYPCSSIRKLAAHNVASSGSSSRAAAPAAPMLDNDDDQDEHGSMFFADKLFATALKRG